MSYGGFEYGGGMNQQYGGFDPMGGFGGGFDMGNGFNSGADSNAKSSEKKKVGDRQSLIPVTAKVLLNAEKQEDTFLVDGCELHTVQLIGSLEALGVHSTNILFKLNDGTDILDCKQWIEKDNANSSILTTMKEGTMIKVIGNMRDYEGKRHLLVFDVSQLVNWNELTHHLLDVILTHLQHTKGPIPSATSSTNSVLSSSSSSMHSPDPRSRMNMNPVAHGNHNMMMVGGGGGSANLHSSIKMEGQQQSLQDVVYQVYTSNNTKSEEGLSVANVLGILRARGVNIQPNNLVAVIRQLCDDGRLYSTMDEDHHKPTSEDY